MWPLRGHATDSPARWKEPRAFAAADHATQRARQGRGRRRIRRRVRGECGKRRGPAGSLIPHAAAIRPLVVTMIEPSFRALSVSPSGRLARSPTRQIATRRRAVGMAAIAGRTNGERTIAEATDLLAEGRVHDVGAAARFDWTRRSDPWHKSDDRLGRRRSIEVVTEGLEASTPGPHLLRRTAQRTRQRPGRSNPGGRWTLTRLWTHRPRPQPLGNLAAEREIPTSVHSPFFSLFFQEEIKTGRASVQVYAVSDDCRHVDGLLGISMRANRLLAALRAAIVHPFGEGVLRGLREVVSRHTRS